MSSDADDMAEDTIYLDEAKKIAINEEIYNDENSAQNSSRISKSWCQKKAV